jgi:integrase
MKWEDVDLDRGRITIESSKTGYTRILPLVGDPVGDIAPIFLGLLESWRGEDPERKYVLPHEDLDAPVFPKGAWYAIDRASGIASIVPQKLRQNFTSYAASLGIPSAVAAKWQGHSAHVAEKHYRAQVLERRLGTKSFEQAFGFGEAVHSLVVGNT